MLVRLLTVADVGGGVRLSTLANWNQLAADWERLLALFPDGCVGGFVDGRMVASGTLATYGEEVGWIGMILVDPATRGQGFGTAIFRAMLEMGRERKLRYMGLDATDLGRPLYEKQGFEVLSGIERWTGKAAARPGDEGVGRRVPPGTPLPGSVIALDREASGVDREGLLRHLHGEAGVVCRVAGDLAEVGAFGFARPGRVMWHVGPVVAGDEGTAAEILRGLLADVAEASPGAMVCVDVPAGSALKGTLEAEGFAVQRRLFRMSLPRCEGALLDGPGVAAAAGFELG